ncbi:hypothetical protein LTR28_004030 [Elasticomyces elasticus]|nr:hypothetical protein LTR28_004030 [Elasticomyces elasticus]
MNEDQTAALSIHNSARAAHGLRELQWDQNLADAATQYAQYLASIGRMQHSEGSGAGENLFMISPVPRPLQAASQGWINEGNNYHGEKIPDGNFGSYGHYTQCMWSSTTNVGMGSAADSNGNFWIVGRYTPLGNWDGQTPYPG